MMFKLYRDGKEVLEGVIFSDNTTVIQWLEKKSTAVFGSWEEFENVHVLHHKYVSHFVFDSGLSEAWIPTRDGLGHWLTNVHLPGHSSGELCTIHNQANDHMKDWPLLWRFDRGMFERICECGTGHPATEQVAFWKATLSPEDAEAQGIHGCCGCCWGGPYEEQQG